MPWDSQTIQKHNHALHGEHAAHAARIANALLRSGHPEGQALAIANAWAQRHRMAAGGAAPDLTGFFSAAQAEAAPYFSGQFMQPSPAAASSAPGPAARAPSYLQGTAGSPVDTSGLPHYRPQVPADMGINSAGLMNVPQVGSFYLDPATGALSSASQDALRAMAQRGLTIGGQGGSSAPAGQAATPTFPPAPLPGSGPEGAGNAGNVGGGVQVNTGGGGGGGFSMPSIDWGGAARGAATGSALGTAAFPGPGTIAGLIGGALIGGFSGHSSGSDASGSSGGPPGDTPEIGGGNTNGLIAAGGRIEKRAAGGMMPASQATPWFARSEAHAMDQHPSGLVVSPIGGRSDHIPMSLAAGSYVVPADVMSGIGQGNGLNGAHRFDQMISSGPFGTKLPSMKTHGTLPKPPAMPRMVGGRHFSRGGRTKSGLVPVIVAGGERILAPHEVAKLSGGDVKKGQEMLDEWVVRTRKEIIDAMKKLPGPKQ